MALLAIVISGKKFSKNYPRFIHLARTLETLSVGNQIRILKIKFLERNSVHLVKTLPGF